jgi:hypothetical protein
LAVLPPVIEIYVVWHPDDAAGKKVADEFVGHFHRIQYSGLIGGAIDVYTRSVGWRSPNDAPRPIPFPDSALPNGMVAPRFVAVVPILATKMAAAVQKGAGPWHDYANEIAAARDRLPTQVGIYGVEMGPSIDGTRLAAIFNRQRMAEPAAMAPAEPDSELRCRDLAQAIEQLLGGERLTVFVSHTERSARPDENLVRLIEMVRRVIGYTRLDAFLFRNALQAGEDWEKALEESAGKHAFLALRTDLYSSRIWCQKEFLVAKRHGVPMVVLSALSDRDERGSFLMDHVPCVPVRRVGEDWNEADVRRGVNLLVDEGLKRALWLQQQNLADDTINSEVAWWSPHSPEPITLVHWLARRRGLVPGTVPKVMHADPPLGPDERTVLNELATLAGLEQIDVMTPRLFAARGG